MDYIPKTVKGGEDGGEKGRGTKLQRGGELRREWNGEGALGGLSLHFCPWAPEFQVTPLPGASPSKSVNLDIRDVFS